MKHVRRLLLLVPLLALIGLLWRCAQPEELHRSFTGQVYRAGDWEPLGETTVSMDGVIEKRNFLPYRFFGKVLVGRQGFANFLSLGMPYLSLSVGSGSRREMLGHIEFYTRDFDRFTIVLYDKIHGDDTAESRVIVCGWTLEEYIDAITLKEQ